VVPDSDAVLVPTFSVTGAAAAAEGTDASFVVSLANRAAGETYGTTVALAGTGGATAGTDFTNALTLDAASIAAGITLVGNVLTIPAASTVSSVTLTTAVAQDSISPETGEGLSVTLSSPTGTGAVIGTPASVTTAITDVPVTYTLTSSAADVFEGVAITYTLTASANMSADTVVAFVVVPGDTAAADQGTNDTNLNDFASGAFNPANVTMLAGTKVATFTVSSRSDGLTELPEEYAVEASIGGTIVGSVTTNLLDGSVGQTYTLTTGTDIIPGTSGDDTIVGVADGVTSITVGPGQPVTETFGGLDEVNGGQGADTLKLTNAVGTMDLAPSVRVSSVETLNITNAVNNITADVQAWTGLSTVVVDNRAGDVASGDLNLDTKSNVTSVSVKGGNEVNIDDNGTAATTADTLATVVLDGVDANNSTWATITSDALTSLSLKNGTGDTEVVAAAGTRTLNVALDKQAFMWVEDHTATTVNVTASGTKSQGINLVTDAATAVTFAGDKEVSLALFDWGGNAAVVGTITSTNSAGVTITSALGNTTAFTGGTGKDNITISNANTKATAMGLGDDTVNVFGTVLGTNGTIDGGDGTDTIAMSAADAAALSALVPANTYEARISSFEKVRLGQVLGGDYNAVDLANLDDISYVVSAGTAASTGISEVQTIAFTAADADGGVLTVGGVDVTIGNFASGADIANAVAAKAADIIAANPDIASLSTDPLRIPIPCG
jgi:hypothetical protein